MQTTAFLEESRLEGGEMTRETGEEEKGEEVRPLSISFYKSEFGGEKKQTESQHSLNSITCTTSSPTHVLKQSIKQYARSTLTKIRFLFQGRILFGLAIPSYQATTSRARTLKDKQKTLPPPPQMILESHFLILPS